MTDRIEAARARIAESREASGDCDVDPRNWYARHAGVLSYFPPVHGDFVHHHSPAAVEALRADLEAALVLAEAVRAWSRRRDGNPELLAALAAFEDGGKDA